MVTLTMADATRPEQRDKVIHRFQVFIKRARRCWPTLKWLAVLEPHPGGHGWHIHMTIDRWLPKQVVADLWGWGFVDIRLIRPKGEKTSRANTRKAAQYVAKYVGKGADEIGEWATPPGKQRYLRSENLDLLVLDGEGDFESLVRLVWSYWPEPISWMWWSGDDSTWRGPPTLVVRSG